jgi:hypothetical protein
MRREVDGLDCWEVSSLSGVGLAHKTLYSKVITQPHASSRAGIPFARVIHFLAPRLLRLFMFSVC